jgi:Ribosome inactivating protein
MTTAIDKLPQIKLDYTQRGPGLQPGMKLIERAFEEHRPGHLLLSIKVPGAVIPVVMRRSDLYLLGFECGGTWYRFDDADWHELAPAAKTLGFKESYRELGELEGIIDANSIAALGKLAQPGQRTAWKPLLRTLVVVVAECARLIPVRTEVLGLLNGVVHKIELEPLAHYIQNWSAASRGTDMSREEKPGLRVGARDPTILKKP